MASDSPPSPLSDDGGLAAEVQSVLWARVAAVASSSPPGTSESIVIGAAIQALHDDEKGELTADEVTRALAHAREKVRRKAAAAARYEKRVAQRQAVMEKWERGLAQCKTRKAESQYREDHPQPIPPSQLITRTSSSTTAAASAAVDALADLRKRNGALRKTKKKRRSVEAPSQLTPPRPELTINTDINPAPSDPSPPHSLMASMGLSTPSSQSSSSSPVTSAKSLPASTSTPFGTGLMTAKARISAQQEKKEMKRKLAHHADGLVSREQERRSQADVMVGKIIGVMDDMKAITPLLHTVLLRMTAQGSGTGHPEGEHGTQSGQSGQSGDSGQSGHSE